MVKIIYKKKQSNNHYDKTTQAHTHLKIQKHNEMIICN